MKNVELEDLKVMSLDEFVSVGLLQEINRRILHPMGLALSVSFDEETGQALSLYNIWDFRHDPEGMRYNKEIIYSKATGKKAEKVEEMFNSKKEYREKNLGYHIQPIGKE